MAEQPQRVIVDPAVRAAEDVFQRMMARFRRMSAAERQNDDAAHMADESPRGLNPINHQRWRRFPPREQGFDVAAEELDTFVRNEIAGYKVPRKIWWVDEIQRTPAGKPDYRWAKDTTEQRPADEVHANHVGANS